MSDINKFWISGINVQPAEAYEGLAIERGCFGAKIKQATEDQDYWFWIAIPSATLLDDENVEFRHVYIRGHADNFVVLKEVQICMNETGASPKTLYTTDRSYNVTGQEIDEDYDVTDQSAEGPISVGMKLHFEQDDGVFTLSAVGGRFVEL